MLEQQITDWHDKPVDKRLGFWSDGNADVCELWGVNDYDLRSLGEWTQGIAYLCPPPQPVPIFPSLRFCPESLVKEKNSMLTRWLSCYQRAPIHPSRPKIEANNGEPF